MRVLVLAFILALQAVPITLAQEPVETMGLAASLSDGTALVSRGASADYPQIARFDFRYQDVSIERVAGGAATNFHYLYAETVWKGEPPNGWTLGTPLYDPSILVAGQQGSGRFEVIPGVSTRIGFVEGLLRLRLENPITLQNTTAELAWSVRIAPQPFAQIELVGTPPEKAGPFDRVQFQVRIENLDAYPAIYRTAGRVLPSDGVDPNEVVVRGLGDRYLQAGETATLNVEFITPRQKLWYTGSYVTMILEVRPVAGGSPNTVFHQVLVQGPYISENLVLLVLAFIGQLILFIWLIVFAKRRYEKRYLGRPIPPWEIPEEAAMLERMKREDPRAHYITRYYLMEDEYRSSLLWFYAYKKISKRQLAADAKAAALRERAAEQAEAPVERFSKAHARLQRRFERRMQRRERWIERRLGRLQAKLERNHEKDHDKAHEKWEKRVERLQKRHNKPYLKAHAKWENDTKKILEKWERPFRKDKERYEKQLAAAKEVYAKKVKKVDKETWRAWREQMEDWELDVKVAKKTGASPPPEPVLVSAAAGPPDLPPPFQEPPKPDLPPEPKPDVHVELPPEPQAGLPRLADSPYARKARRIERKGERKIRKLERKLAAALVEIEDDRTQRLDKAQRDRARLEAASQAVSEPSLVDKVLRRTPEQMERRHHLAYLKGRAAQRIKEAREREEAQVERARLEMDRAEAELEARLIRERSALERSHAAQDAQRVDTLEAELATARKTNAARLATVRAEAKARFEQQREAIRTELQESLKREGVAQPAAEATTATES